MSKCTLKFIKDLYNIKVLIYVSGKKSLKTNIIHFLKYRINEFSFLKVRRGLLFNQK